MAPTQQSQNQQHKEFGLVSMLLQLGDCCNSITRPPCVGDQ